VDSIAGSNEGSSTLVEAGVAPPYCWYGIRVRSRFERVTSTALRSKGIEEFLPLVQVRRRWSDRIKQVEVPLFPGYVFSRFDLNARLPILECAGVLHLVSIGGAPAPIPEEELQAIRLMIDSKLPIEPYPFLRAGQKIRVDHGPLAGVEGIVVRLKNAFRLVAAVTLLQRSVSVEIDPAWVSPVP
jgi:transcription termination/antitermination protein NusG